MPALPIGDRRLGAILLQLGFISDTDMQKAIERHGEIGGRLSDILIESGTVTERKIAHRGRTLVPLGEFAGARAKTNARSDRTDRGRKSHRTAGVSVQT
jgi:hypothetical protein